MNAFGKLAGAVLALATISPALAETAPAPAPAAAATKHYTTQETTIGDLLADPAAKAIIDKHIPELSDNPSISMASGATLRALQQMAGDKISTEALDAIDADLAKIPGK